MNEEHKKKLDRLEELIKQSPEKKELWIERGNLFIEIGNQPEAAKSFEKLCSIDPADIKAWIISSNLYLKCNETEKALYLIENGLQYNPKAKSLWLKKAEILALFNKVEDIIKCLDIALQIDPKDLKLWQEKLEILKYSNRPKEIWDCLHNIRLLAPQRIDLWIEQGEILLKAQKYDQAINFYNSLLPSGFDPIYLKNKVCEALISLERYEEAIKLNLEVLKNSPDNEFAVKLKASLDYYLNLKAEEIPEEDKKWAPKPAQIKQEKPAPEEKKDLQDSKIDIESKKWDHASEKPKENSKQQEPIEPSFTTEDNDPFIEPPSAADTAKLEKLRKKQKEEPKKPKEIIYCDICGMDIKGEVCDNCGYNIVSKERVALEKDKLSINKPAIKSTLSSDKIKSSTKSDDLNIFISIFTKPRSTMRYILDYDRPGIGFLFFIVFLNYFIGGYAGYLNNPDPTLQSTIILFILGGSFLFSIISLFIAPIFLSIPGRWLGGKGYYKDLQIAFCFSSYPFIFTNIVSLIVALIAPAYNAKEAFSPTCFVFCTFALIIFLVSLWFLIISLKLIAEAHQFSIWRSIILLGILIAIATFLLISFAIIFSLLAALFIPH